MDGVRLEVGRRTRCPVNQHRWSIDAPTTECLVACNCGAHYATISWADGKWSFRPVDAPPPAVEPGDIFVAHVKAGLLTGGLCERIQDMEAR